MQVLQTQTLHDVTSSRRFRRTLIPGAPVLVQIFQTLQVTAFGRRFTRTLIPHAPVLVQIFQKLQVTT
jgi:hypothetical protein